MDRLRLILSPDRYSKPQELADDAPLPPPSSNGGDKVSDDVINQVDEFLCEAIRRTPFQYMQRFDPEFGFNGGSHTMQPMYTAVLNCNTEFPQLGSTHGLQFSTEHHPQPLPWHIPRPWAPPSPAGMGYGHPEAILSPFNPRKVGAHSAPT